MSSLLLFLGMCVAASFAVPTPDADTKKDVIEPPGEGIEGAYELKDKPEKAFYDLLKEIGVPKDKIDAMMKNHHMRIQITMNPVTKLYTAVITCKSDKKTLKLSFEHGKEFEHTFINGQTAKVTVMVEGTNRMVVTRKFPNYKVITTATFSKAGMEANIVAKDKFKAKVKFARAAIIYD